MYGSEGEENKPPIGTSLNKKAIITLHGYWPHCKTTRQPIRDPQAILSLKYIDKLKNAVKNLGATFLDYQLETGTCVFEVC